jgi:hypothetical protein
MTDKTYQYVTAIGVLAVVAGIVVAVNYNKSAKKDETSKKNNAQGLLAGLGTSDSASTFDVAALAEAYKMSLPLALKNTIMSFEALENLNELPIASPNTSINPFMNRGQNSNKLNIPKLKYPQNVREGVFYIQVGNRVITRTGDNNNFSDLPFTPGDLDLHRRNFDIETQSATTNTGQEMYMPFMFKYAPRGKVRIEDSSQNLIIDTENDFVQDYATPVNMQNIKTNVPEGCTILITTPGGVSRIVGPVVNAVLTLPSVSKIEVQTPGYYDFFLKNFVGRFEGRDNGGNFNNIIVGNQEFQARKTTLGVNTFPPNKVFYIIHGIDGSMLRPDQGGLVYADQWATWDNNRSVKRNEINFIPTGDRDNSYYIKFVSNGGLFNAKDDNYVDWNGKIGSNSAKWIIEKEGSWQEDGIGSYKIKSVAKNLYLNWANQAGPSWVTLTSGGRWLGIYDDATINSNAWQGYIYGQISSKEGGVWNQNIPVGGTIIQYARLWGDPAHGINNFGGSAYGVSPNNNKHWNKNSMAGSQSYGGNHALFQANKKTPQEPKHTLRTLKTDTQITDNNSCRFRVELDERNRMFIRHVETGLYLSSYAPYLVSKDVALNMDHAVVKLHPVLTDVRAQFFYKASVSFFNQDMGKPFLRSFCDYDNPLSNKFPDGTLKMGTGTKLSANRILNAFERICACNMDSNFYKELFCPDKFFKDTYGITDAGQINLLRGTLKCDIPNCVYPLCQDIFTQPTLDSVKNAKSMSKDCGAAAVCFASVTVNNTGTINRGLTANITQNCGASMSNDSVIIEPKGTYMWQDQTKNVIIQDYKCTMANTTPPKELEKSNFLCTQKLNNNVDERNKIILFDFTRSRITQNIDNQRLIYTINDVSGGMPPVSTSQELQTLIRDKFGIKGVNADYTFEIIRPNIKITTIERISCGQPQTMCEYINGKWVTKSTFTRPSTSPLTEAEFKQSCAPTQTDGCTQNNDCVIGSSTTVQSCSPSTSQQIINFPITRLPSGSGKSCEQVVGSMSGMPNFQISTENNIVKATKTCAEDNKWNETCVASGTNKLVQKISQCIPEGNANCVDKVCIDWPSGATIQTEFTPNPSDPSKGTKRVTVNLTSINPAKLDTPEMKEFIRSRLGLNDQFTVTTQNNQLIITINYNCGTLQKQPESQCVYEGGKWVQKFNNVFTNPVGIAGTEFSQQCKSTSSQDDCKESKNCELTLDNSISSNCVGGKQKMGLFISKNPSASGKSCIDVAKEQNPGFTFNVDPQMPTRILGEKTCTINNSWNNVCVTDSANTNRLLNKLKECLPAGNDECKDKICIDWPAESTITTRYDAIANEGKGKKVVTVTMRDIDRNLIQTDPEVRRFIQSKLSTTDNVTYTYDGNNLVITVDYTCGSLEKTYAEDCEMKDGGWIRRFTQTYKNPSNVESAKFDSLCALPNSSGSESCNINKDCEVLQDTTLTATCANNKQRVGYRVKTPANKDGKSCVDILKVVEPNVTFTLDNGVYVGDKACSMPVQNIDCQIGEFGACSVPCGGGTQTAPIITQKQGNGKECPPTSRACNTQACPPPASTDVDCQIGEFGACSVPCGGGTQTAPILINKQGNGKECPPTSRACNTQVCPPASTPAVDCVVGNFGECSKPCGGGMRSRPIITNKQGNGKECPPLFENCNTQECPKEEKKEEVEGDKTNQMLMVVIGVMGVLIVGGGVAFAMRKK